MPDPRDAAGRWGYRIAGHRVEGQQIAGFRVAVRAALAVALLLLLPGREAGAQDVSVAVSGSAAATTSGTTPGTIPGTTPGTAPGFVAWQAVGDTIPEPLGGLVGDPTRGERLVADRRESLCLLCHQGPFPLPRMQGTIAPPLPGAGARWSEAQLRLRVVDARMLNADSIMPTYHREGDRERVGRAWQGSPVLDAQQIEDVVAWLATLK